MADQWWNLCICGNVEELFAVLVEADKTVVELKAVIEHKSHIPVKDQSLYFQEQLMQDDRVLSSFPGLSDGGIVYLSRRPLTLNILSLLGDSPEELQFKIGHDIMNHSVICLRDIIYNRMDIKSDTSCLMMCGGELLNVNKKLSEYSTFRDGTKIVLQESPVLVKLREGEVQCKYYTPQNTKMSFLKRQLSYETGASQSQLKCGAYVSKSEFETVKQSQNLQFKDSYLSKDDQDEVANSNMEIIRRDGWILDVQRLDGTKVSVHVSERKHMPIVKLKECIEMSTGVPTHQQRLTIGSTIVEDWDDEDRMMFIGNYPNIHDGSLLYLVQLEGGNRLMVYNINSNQIKLVRRGPGTVEYHYQANYIYVDSVMNDDQLKSRLKIRIFTRNYEYFGNNPGASFVSDKDSVVALVYDNIQW